MSHDAPYIRNVLRVAIEARRAVRDMKPAERIARDDLGAYLNGVIERLKGLDIPRRLQTEREVREVEIGACEDAIRDWLKERGQGYLIRPSGPTLIVPEVAKAAERLYGRRGVVLRVINGGKK